MFSVPLSSRNRHYTTHTTTIHVCSFCAALILPRLSDARLGFFCVLRNSRLSSNLRLRSHPVSLALLYYFLLVANHLYLLYLTVHHHHHLLLLLQL
jgi:hypothetical protein